MRFTAQWKEMLKLLRSLWGKTRRKPAPVVLTVNPSTRTWAWSSADGRYQAGAGTKRSSHLELVLMGLNSAVRELGDIELFMVDPPKALRRALSGESVKVPQRVAPLLAETVENRTRTTVTEDVHPELEAAHKRALKRQRRRSKKARRSAEARPTDWLRVATDGSHDHLLQLGAWCWWVDSGRWASGWFPDGSSSGAETEAIAQALAATQGMNVEIISDCRSVVQRLVRLQNEGLRALNLRNLDESERDSWRRIAALSAGREVRARWVRAHTGGKKELHILNQKADMRARAELRSRRRAQAVLASRSSGD